MKKIKTAVLMLSTNYMAGSSRAGEATGFKDKLLSGDKLHTMRGNYPYWANKAAQINAGEMELSVRQWSGRPYNSNQVEIAKFNSLQVQRFEMYWYKKQRECGELPTVCIDGKIHTDIEALARNDGLTMEDWLEWFFKREETVSGCIIHFTNFKY